MKKAINRWALPGSWSLGECIAATKRHGFDGLELNLEESGDLSLDTPSDVLTAAADKVRAAGLDIPAIATGLYWTRSLSSPDDVERQAGLEVARKQMRMATAMDVNHLLIVPGAVDVFFLPDKKPVPYEVAYRNAQRSLRTLADEAEASKLVLCLENVWNRFLLSPLEFRRFLDEIDSLLVRAYFDVGNVYEFGHPDDWIRILGARVSRVHVKDYKRSVGTAAGFTGLGKGEIDWPGVMRALVEVGYDSWITAELFRGKDEDPHTFLAETSAAMDVILTHA
jgi:hexulose-6-phosphate isomerase